MTPEKWDSNWKFVAGDQTWIDDTKYNVWRIWVVNHMIHHRAQLGVFLRLLGQKIPGVLRAVGGRDVKAEAGTQGLWTEPGN